LRVSELPTMPDLDVVAQRPEMGLTVLAAHYW